MKLRARVFIISFFCTVLALGLSVLAAKKSSELEQKAGRMIMVGFRGTSLSDGSKENEILKKELKEGLVGGVILFDRDILTKSQTRNVKDQEQLKNLVSELKENSKIRLLVAIDQEGGKVARLREKHGFKEIRSHKELADTGDIKETYKDASEIAQILKTTGININFAPVVDMAVNPENPVIAKLERSFSQDPEVVISHSREFIRAHTENNILSVIKHFPGHGSSQNDSHKGFVDVSDSWTEKELKPFQELINEGSVKAIMTAHIFNSLLDPEYPATLSKKIITDLLRVRMNYDGLVISDDLQMRAISEHYSLKESVILAVNAGVDILLFGNNLDFDPEIAKKVRKIIIDAVKSGEISEKRLDESNERIKRIERIVLVRD